MPPKKKQKTEEARATIVASDTVTNVMIRAAENVEAIKGHKAFKDIMKAEPLSIADGGRCEPYSDDTFKVAFSKGGDVESFMKYYTCGFNFMWINHAKRAMVGVPISSRSVASLVETTRIMTGDLGVLDVAVANAEDFPSKFRGAIERLTPPEESFALLELIRKDVDANNTDRLAMWKKKMLTVQVNIRVMPDANDRWWFEYNFRETTGERFDALYQTTYQKVCAICRIATGIAEKEGAAQATSSKVFQALRNGASTLEAPKVHGAEPMSDSFIKQCLIIRDNLFSINRCKDIIAELDELQGHDSVLNSVYKLTTIRNIARSSAPLMEWVLEAIRDGVLRKSPFFEGKTVIRDFQQTNSGKNIVSTIVAKKEFLDFALGQASQMFTHEVVTKLREVFSSYEEYRKFKPIDGAEPTTGWMANWPVPARIFLEFISDAVFTFNPPYVNAFQTLARRNVAVSTLVEQNVAISEEWARIKKGVEDDAKAARVKAEMDAKEAGKTDNGADEDGDAQRPVKVEGDGNNDPADGNDLGSFTRESNPRAYWMRFAQETVRSRVVLMPMPETASELTEILKTSDVNQLNYTPGLNTVLKVWDEKLASEAASMPWIRKCPHRGNVFKKAIASSLSANAVEPGLAKGEMVVVFDHGKQVMANNAQRLFQNMPHHTQTYELQYDEESMTVRRKRLKGRKPLIKQTEKLMVYVADKKYIPDSKRIHYAGTNRGQQWGFIALPLHTAVWRVKPEDKREALGEAMRPVGGRVQEEDGSDDEVCSEDETAETYDDNLVPFAYHGLPKTFFQSMVHAFKAKGIVDFTPGDGTLAEVALESEEVLYLGFCHTERHCSMLRARLGQQVMAAMQKEDSPLFSQLCVSDLKRKTCDPTPKLKAKGKVKAEKKKKKKKKGKKEKKDKESSEDSSDEESSASSSPAGGDDDE